MITRLQISNYALIDTVDIALGPGFNIITGETGAGKSIMLGALSLLLGGRADSRVIRHHDAKSVIEATFSTTDAPEALKQYCSDNDLDWDDDAFILRREITPTGRSRAFINDSPVSISQLRNVAIHLVDIHSQHQNLLLASPAFQLRVLDNLAENAELLSIYATRYRTLRRLALKLKTAKANLQKAHDEEDYIRHQYERIASLKLEPGMQAELERHRELLSNVNEIKGRLSSTSTLLCSGSENAFDLIKAAITRIESYSSSIPEGDTLLNRLHSAAIEIKDIAESLDDFDNTLEANPDELEAVEEKLSAIYNLQSRHHLENEDQLIALRDDLASKLAVIDNGADDIAELEKQTRAALAQVKETAALLGERRREAAKLFASTLAATAAPLGMHNLRVEIAVKLADLSSTGMDAVEFLFAFNKNQPLMPVSATASGGEISRLMLSLKSILAGRMSLPTIIFDEIDTGVSGDVAARMAEMMDAIADNLQVIAITHLPQVAARGSIHFKVYKEDDEHATHTRIMPLDRQGRIAEISTMLCGNPDDEASRAVAAALISRQQPNKLS